MTVKRKRDWRQRLTSYILKEQRNPREWSDTVCAFFTADAIKEMTGTDIMRGYRRYKDKAKATAALKKAGYTDHIDRLKEQLEEIAPGIASPGDLALLDNGAFGIFQGEYIYTIVPGQGVTLVAADSAKRAFKVPEENG